MFRDTFFDKMLLIDGYKLDHRRQYPPGTTKVYSNWTPRSSRINGVDEVVFFGLQYFLKNYLGWDSFFGESNLAAFDKFTENYVGPNYIGTNHLRALHTLGYFPLRFCALPEGTKVPLRVPMFTVENTHPDFFWLPNYIETILSNVLWMPCTSATIANRYRKLLDSYAIETGDPAFVDWQGHDFSFRGMAGVEAAVLSGAGHLLSFTGTDTIPAIKFLETYYGAKGLIGGSVTATEHSVMCAGGKESEKETFERLLDLYPSGILSVVSDTWDLWKVITEILPSLKDKIITREGKLVIRPDSGDPVDILCGAELKGLPEAGNTCGLRASAKSKGVIESLWDIFGGTINAKGYKVLDPHIGAIYGDSITFDRAKEICERLKAKGFASTNVVLGIGSYTYQYNTRDTFGFAMKATWAEINGVGHDLFKKPVTDDGTKFSACGRLAVFEESGKLYAAQEVTPALEKKSLLQPVWEDGKFLVTHTLEDIRKRVSGVAV